MAKLKGARLDGVSFTLEAELLPQVIASGVTGRDGTPEAMTCDGWRPT